MFDNFTTYNIYHIMILHYIVSNSSILAKYAIKIDNIWNFCITMYNQIINV